jgi:hypothetical protein
MHLTLVSACRVEAHYSFLANGEKEIMYGLNALIRA